MDGSESNPVVVLYIGGPGRSGSTILAALLGNHDGFFPVGEMRDVWQALTTDELCGCGRSFSNCEFWRSVGDRAFGGWDRIDADAMLQADRHWGRHRRVPRLLVSSWLGREPASLSQYRRHLARLYAAVREVSSCRVIVDSNKTAVFALLLSRVAGLDLRFVHLVRDSRGVSYSWSKKGIEKPEYAHIPTLRFMNRRSSWSAALNWDLGNLLFPLLTPSARRRLVKYESLVAQPSQELGRIIRLADESSTPASSAVDPHRDEYLSGPFHTIGGNPVRFRRGRITLQADDEWKTEMRLSRKLLVTALTLPLLVAYRYVGIGRPRRSL